MQSLSEKIKEAKSKRDLERLRLLHHALTKSRGASRYAQMTHTEAEEAAREVEAAISELGPRQEQKSKPRQSPRQVDVATLGKHHGLFADVGKWPRKPYCTDNFDHGLLIRPLARAVSYRYIQPNPPHLRAHLLFDIDRPGAAMAWEKAGLLKPTWVSVNPVNGHAHLAWDLTTPVLIDGLGARDAPMRFLSAIEAVMTQRLDADPGFVGLITKNPVHAAWEVTSEPRSYALAELASVLPGIEKYRPPKKSIELVGVVERNIWLFDTLRKQSYSTIRKYWGSGLSGWNAWLSHCNSTALCMNANLGARALQGNEVWHVSKSVAKWVWRNFTPEKFSGWQAAQGRKGGLKGGVARSQSYEQQRAQARIMRAGGMTQTAIAKELNVTDRTVRTWLAGTGK